MTSLNDMKDGAKFRRFLRCSQPSLNSLNNNFVVSWWKRQNPKLNETTITLTQYLSLDSTMLPQSSTGDPSALRYENERRTKLHHFVLLVLWLPWKFFLEKGCVCVCSKHEWWRVPIDWLAWKAREPLQARRSIRRVRWKVPGGMIQSYGGSILRCWEGWS